MFCLITPGTTYKIGQMATHHSGQVYGVFDVALANANEPSDYRNSGWWNLTRSLQVRTKDSSNTARDIKSGEIVYGGADNNEFRGWYLCLRDVANVRRSEIPAGRFAIPQTFLRMDHELTLNVNTPATRRLDSMLHNHEVFSIDPQSSDAEALEETGDVHRTYKASQLKAVIDAHQSPVTHLLRVHCNS